MSAWGEWASEAVHSDDEWAKRFLLVHERAELGWRACTDAMIVVERQDAALRRLSGELARVRTELVDASEELEAVTSALEDYERAPLTA